MTAQRELKQHIRAFMRSAYTDERLAQLLAHAQDGKLSFKSCCCFIGIATAEHPLHGRGDYTNSEHLHVARRLNGSFAAEESFMLLCNGAGDDTRDAQRIRILIPMIRAEMRRRERARPETVPASAVETPAEASI